jgi:choline dehydrogenase-like flavoprotein
MAQIKVVIVGAGFGGLATAKALRNTPASVTLIDRANHHLFQHFNKAGMPAGRFTAALWAGRRRNHSSTSIRAAWRLWGEGSPFCRSANRKDPSERLLSLACMGGRAPAVLSDIQSPRERVRSVGLD